MLTCAVFGARGYLGRETMRLLAGHPDVGTLLPVSTTSAGSPVAEVLASFHGIEADFCTDQEALDAAPDVVFFATPAGVAAEWAPRFEGATVIDLSRDHRTEALQGGAWTYGQADLWPVPEGTRTIANPGCYPTATLLAAAPTLQAGLAAAGPLIADGKSGVSGAGASPRADLHFPAANESVRAYKVVGHDHQEEIQGAVARLENAMAPAGGRKVRFTPHLVPQNRGLLSTVYLPTEASPEDVQEAYRAAYQDTAFVHVRGEPDTAQVRGSNHALVAVDVDDGILVARCAIDNLLKGGAGTAVQNMNDAHGLPSTMGLTAITGGV